jgi:hypothetical protein
MAYGHGLIYMDGEGILPTDITFRNDSIITSAPSSVSWEWKVGDVIFSTDETAILSTGIDDSLLSYLITIGVNIYL